ncbi:MAG: class I SAM-dependent methyltransferase [Eubacteriales bacterium]|nr:class I SAM-dependent methyltransferase [Eubacteriales bacterium]
MPDLSVRLQAVLDCVRPCQCLYDIGTDHAFLPIEAISRGVTQRAVASDIGEGPIRSAHRNIKRFAMSDKIMTAVTPGLHGHEPQAHDAVVMAGLGGLEMIDILHAAGPLEAQLILQPQKSAMELRIWLDDNGYFITHEALVRDRAKMYAIITVKHRTPEQQKTLSPIDAYLGPILRQKEPELFSDYLDERIDHLRKAVRSQPHLQNVLDQITEVYR